MFFCLLNTSVRPAYTNTHIKKAAHAQVESSRRAGICGNLFRTRQELMARTKSVL